MHNRPLLYITRSVHSNAALPSSSHLIYFPNNNQQWLNLCTWWKATRGAFRLLIWPTIARTITITIQLQNESKTKKCQKKQKTQKREKHHYEHNLVDENQLQPAKMPYRNPLNQQLTNPIKSKQNLTKNY